MKIGLVYYQYPLYKGGSHIQDFIIALAKDKRIEKLTLIATHYPKTSFKQLKKVKIIFVPSIKIPIIGDLSFIFFTFFAMLFSSDFRKADLINVICARGILSTFLFSKIFKKPLIATIELLNNPNNNSLLEKIYSSLQKFQYSKINFNEIICWSKFYYQKYLKPWGISKNKITYISNGINTKQYSPTINGTSIKNKYAANSNLIVFAKPLYQYNFISAKLLLSVIKKLTDENYNIHLLLGKGEYLPQTKKIIKSLNLNKYVSFMPFVPMTQIPRYIAASDIIVLPFLYEATISRSLLEAMSMSKPIITTNLGEIPKILINNKEAIIIKPNIELIVKNIKFLLKNKLFAQKLGKNARIKCEKFYSFNTISKQTINLYQKTLKSNG